MRAPLALAVAVVLAACEHTDPFRPRDGGPDGPFTPAPVTRLTLSAGHDFAPAWLPGAAGILYSAERLDRADRDRCLAELPPAGGAITRYACRTTASDDSVNVFEEAAVAADGRIAYVRVSSSRFPFPPIAPGAQALVVATLANPNEGRAVLTIGYLAPPPSNRQHQGVSHIQWLGPNRLVFVGDNVVYRRPCPSCDRDTLRTGIEIVTLDISGPTPALAVVPGTDGASGVAVGGGGGGGGGAAGDTIYYTRNGDSRVFRHVFSSGQTDTIHDFGAAGIARDPSVAGDRLVAVVGGAVVHEVDSVLGATQVDSGGGLHLVRLGTGTDSVLVPAFTRTRRPVLSPDGTRVVFELRTNPIPDLWLLEVP